MHTNASLFTAVDALGSSDGDLNCLCGKMQLVSHILKSDRFDSHPERLIGAGNCIKEVSSPLFESIDLIPRICANLPSLASAAGHRYQSSFFNFFFLSLLLDILKAQKSLEISAVINLNCEEINHLVQLNDYLTVSSLVMNILKEKVVSTNPEWLNSRCCCLKVFNKYFVLSWPLCSRLHVWPNFFIIAFIRFLRGINESQNPSSQLLFFSIFHTIYTHQYLL